MNIECNNIVYNEPICPRNKQPMFMLKWLHVTLSLVGVSTFTGVFFITVEWFCPSTKWNEPST